jgi:hypothetical protein
MKILFAGRVIDTNVIPVGILLSPEEIAPLGSMPLHKCSRFWAFPESMTWDEAQKRMGVEENRAVMYPEEGT